MADESAATTTTTETATTQQPSVEQSADARNADFAKALHEELLSEANQGDAGAQTDAPADAKPKPSITGKQVDSIKVLELLRRGDLTALAKELDVDPGDFRVKKSEYHNFRADRSKQRNWVNEQRAQIEQERASLRQQADAIKSSNALLIRASQQLQDEDFVGFVETVTGKPFDEFQKIAIQSSIDPGAKEIRRLRAEQAERDRRDAEREELANRERVTAEQRRAIEEHKSELRAELFEDQELGLKEFETSPNMARFINAVFEEQKQAFDGQNTISAKTAAKRAIARLLAEHEGWSPFVTRFGTGANAKTEQGHRGATKTASKSVARSQSGPPTDTRQMSPQEKFAHFGAQLRQELASQR